MRFCFTRFILILGIFILIAQRPALASLDIVVSEPQLSITTGFNGDTLTLFGTTPKTGDLVILIKGPEKDTIVRKKTDIFGLWIQAQSVTFENVPHYYNIASSKSVLDITSSDIRKKLKIGLDELNFRTKDAELPTNQKTLFQEALIQNMQLKKLYSLTPNAVNYINDTLFETKINIPSNVPIGNYLIDAFLFQDGKLIDRKTHPFVVRQTGMTADIYNFAHDHAFFYGVFVIFLAILSSLLAVILLRRE